jgi:plastocyanin
MRPGRYLPVVAALLFGAIAVPAHAATIQITIDNLVFAPAEVSVNVGDTIEWINKDVLAHTATARNGDFDVTTPPKKTVTSVLKKAGSVEYYCRFHPNMKAVLTIAP